MRFSGKMNDGVDRVLRHHATREFGVGYIAVDEREAGIPLEARERGAVARVRQRIQHDHSVAVVMSKPVVDEVAAKLTEALANDRDVLNWLKEYPSMVATSAVDAALGDKWGA